LHENQEGLGTPVTRGSKPLLEIRELVKDYPGQRALDGVDLVINAGEIRALLGHNGAGKSTVVRILSGATPASGGHILLDGERYSPSNPADARDAGIGVVYQNAPIIDTLNVAENLVLGFPYPRRAGFLVDWKELERWAHERWTQALGELQPPPYNMLMRDLEPRDHWLVAIARAVLHSPRLLVLDESTVAFSAAETEHVHNTIRRLANEGTAIIYVTHRLQEALSVADSVTVLRDGRVVTSTDVKDMTHEALIRHLAGERRAVAAAESRVRSAQPILECDALCAGVVQNLSLQLQEGEILGLAGLEGSGTRDLLRALFGVSKIKAGGIRLRGNAISVKNPRQAIARGFAFVPADRHQQAILSDSISHNVALPSLDKLRRWYRLLDQRLERQEATKLAKRLEVKMRSVADDLNSLSGGNRQKVVLAKWLMTQPSILLLEEPTQGVDVGAAGEIRRFIRSLAGEGMSVIVATADLKELVDVCDRVVVLSKGKLCQEFERPFGEEEVLSACYKVPA
jgi:ABC-type sugar transport system ATPase subunit